METTWRDRLRYRVDEFFGRGTIALILGLFAVSVLIILLIAIVVAVTGVGGEDRRSSSSSGWASCAPSTRGRWAATRACRRSSARCSP